MKYYVYEIMGDKVGSTRNYPQRPIDQGAKEGEYQLLWEGDCEEEMLRQEVIHQNKLNYKKDPFHGHITFKQQEGAHTVTIVKDEKKLHTLLQNASVTVDSEYGKIKFKGQDEIQALIDILATGPYGGWFVKVKKARNLREELDERRMDIIGQNGNDGLHYDGDETNYDQIATMTNGNTTESGSIREACDKSKATIKEFDQIRDWATNKGIFTSGDPKTQFLKLQEEAGEVARAILKQDQPEIIDGLGDTLVVLINLSHLCGYRLEDCLASAYEVIAKRTGKMENGTFVKDA